MASRFSAVFLMTVVLLFRGQDVAAFDPQIEFQRLTDRLAGINLTLLANVQSDVTSMQDQLDSLRHQVKSVNGTVQRILQIPSTGGNARQDIIQQQFNDLAEQLNSTLQNLASTNVGELHSMQMDIGFIQNSIGFLQNNIGNIQTMVVCLQTGACSGSRHQDVNSLEDVYSFQKQLESLKATIQAQGNNGISGRVSSSDELEALDVMLVTTPAVTTILIDTIVKYNREFVNVNNGYSSETGYYNAPMDGVYNFLLTGKAGGSAIVLTLWYQHSNTSSTRALCSLNMQPRDSSSCGAVVKMEQGDKVYVKTSLYGSGQIQTSDLGDNKLTGFMMRRTRKNCKMHG